MKYLKGQSQIMALSFQHCLHVELDWLFKMEAIKNVSKKDVENVYKTSSDNIRACNTISMKF